LASDSPSPPGSQNREDAPIPTSAGRIPLSLYVHIPWCVRKCPYCDFNSHAMRKAIDQAAYVDALLLDLDAELTRQPQPEIESIFVGGGTPSLFDGAVIARLLDGIAQRFTLVPDVEITLEANPGTAEVAHFSSYRAAGVGRLSIGVQSLDDGKLAALGRIHSADEARAAYRMARKAGFDNVNLDLMYGLPQQSTSAALADLGAIIELGPEHISWYQLTLEPNTLFHRQPPPLPDEDSLVDMMEGGQAMLADAGYLQYEISAFAHDDRQCRHNLNYWQFGDYLGIGAGAHGKLSRPGPGVRRRSKQRQPAAYMAAAAEGAVALEQEIGQDELAVEFFLNALRLTAGVPAGLFESRTGLALHMVERPLGRARELGLMLDDPTRLQASAHGQRYLNDLLVLFEPD
jgi:oxygen-independent coproporphyrinogen-3 oxidase